MRRALLGVALLWATAAAAFSQQSDAVLKSFQGNFDRGDVTVKTKVLDDGARQTGIDMGPLYLQALDYIVNNVQTLRSDASGNQLILTAVRLVGAQKFTKAADPLWSLFTADSDTQVRAAIMGALAQIVPSSADLVEKINFWLATQNTLLDSGTQVDLQVVNACIATLGTIAKASSFPVLFSTSLEGYPPETRGAAAAAYGRIGGDPKTLYSMVIKLNKTSDKLAALNAVTSSSTISTADKAEIATLALQTALAAATRSADEQAALNRLRFAAVLELGALKWAPASPLLIQNFDRSLDEFSRGMLGESDFVSAIAALGATGTHEAAVRLSLYLDLIHTYVEKGQTYNERVVTAVIGSLGAIGDPVALENLLYTQYLNYSDAVKKAAREAVANLRTH